MKKTMSLVLSLTFISTFLFGCQPGDDITADNNKMTKVEQQTGVVAETDSEKVGTNQQLEEDGEKLKLEAEITKVSISKLQGKVTTVFDDSGSLNTIDDIMSSVVKQSGIVNMASPEFNLEVAYANDNKQTLYLWIGKKGRQSTFMNSNNTHTIYMVSEEMTDKLIDLIE